MIRRGEGKGVAGAIILATYRMVEPVAVEIAADVAHGLGHWKLSGGLGQWKLTRTMYPFIVVQRNILLESWHLVEIGVQRRWESVEHGPCYWTWTRAAFKKEIEGRPSTRSIGDLPPEVLNFTVCYAKTL